MPLLAKDLGFQSFARRLYEGWRVELPEIELHPNCLRSMTALGEFVEEHGDKLGDTLFQFVVREINETSTDGMRIDLREVGEELQRAVTDLSFLKYALATAYGHDWGKWVEGEQ